VTGAPPGGAPVPGYEISRDPGRLDRALVHRFLSRESYWSPGISRDLVDRALEASLPFGIYLPEAGAGDQVGFGRVVTDGVYLAYVADVFVLEPHRGRGLARWLVHTMLAAPDLDRVRWWLLGTADAHSLYASLGFRGIADPDRLMEIRR
jgi:GNAT superfamily N-acetyltransferase